MEQKLRPIGLYALNEGDPLALELTVYGEELDRVYDALDELLREAFIETAESYGLENRERFTGAVHDDETVERRRERQLTLSQDVEGARNEAGLLRLLSCVTDSRCEVDVTYRPTTIYVTTLDPTTEAERKSLERLMDKVLPVHADKIMTYR
jgi:hypothetical protein